MPHASSLLSRVVAFTTLGRLYSQAAAPDPARSFASRALVALDVTPVVADEETAHIPASGPLVVVANHPFGALDGLLLLDLLGRVRRDVRLLGNRWLRAVPQLRTHLLPVDVFGGPAAVPRNGSALRGALRWLAQGGCVVIFPAGEVAHAACDGRIVDSPWHTTAASLARRAGASVVPVFVDGQNSALFRAAGRVHPLLRTALLPRELLARRGSRVPVRIGAPIAPTSLPSAGCASDGTQLLRAAVEALARPAAARAAAPPQAAPAPEPIAASGPRDPIAANVAALGQPLLESGRFQVFCARAGDIPVVLPELGRLREIAFRAAGEGTGRARDLDGFDETYHHLFVWDRQAGEIAGAYRLGATEAVLPAAGVRGLYTQTLFDYGDELMAQLGPALELGRSFVAPSYQRDFSPLLLLWKGISRWVALHPRYRRLFGVVSISDSYDSTSRQLMIAFLQTTRFDADLGRLVRARNPPAPPRAGTLDGATVKRLEDVSALIRGIEPDGKDMPVLLRQYLKLNARLLGFTIDPAFGNVLDGLVVVDLDDVEPAILARYMGRAEADAFRAQAPAAAAQSFGLVAKTVSSVTKPRSSSSRTALTV